MRILLLLLTFGALPSALATPRPVTLEDVTTQVTQANYFVRENAERVYQAKASVQLARRNLLPKINLWRVVESVGSPQSLLGIVADIAPFLVPNNWFRVGEEKLFAEATTHGYRALWANELLTARGLLLQASLDERLLEQVSENVNDLEKLTAMVRSREVLGTIPAGSLKQLEVRQLAAEEELRGFTRITHENRTQLSYILGFPGNEEAVPSGVRYSNLNNARPLVYGDYEERVLASSFEIKQYDSLIQAARKVRKGRYFNFLGTSSITRSAAGSVFDSLPQQDGLGFGLGPSVRIVKSEQRLLEIQKTAIQETLKRNLKILVESFNLDLLSRADAIQRRKLTEELWTLLTNRIRLGASVSAFDLVEASRNRVEAISAYYAAEIRLLLNADRLKRLMYSDVYRIVEGPLP